jgi:hypothetical protein
MRNIFCIVASLGVVGLGLSDLNAGTKLPADFEASSLAKPVTDTSFSESSRLLCSKRWIYDEYVRDFHGASPQFFKRSRSRNHFDLHKNWVEFHLDGGFDEYNENGERLKGEWEFLDNGTRIRTRIPGTWHQNTSTILVLTEDRFEWNDDDHDTYGEMIHPGQPRVDQSNL